MHVIEAWGWPPYYVPPYYFHLVASHESILHRRPCDGQERLVNTDRHFIDARMQTGEVVRYELLLGYRDTLIYAHGLTLYHGHGPTPGPLLGNDCL